MATPNTKKRKQVILKRDAAGNLRYDSNTGNPLLKKTVRKSRRGKNSFAQEAVPKSGPVIVRELTPEERERYTKRRIRPCGVPPL